MRKNKYELIHRSILLFLLFICFASSIIGLIVSVKDIMALSKSGIFESVLILIANIFMLVCVLFIVYRVINSYKSGSIFMKELMLTYDKKGKTRPMIITLISGVIFLGLTILFILMLTDVVINTVFPKGLDAAMVTFSFLLSIGGFSFFAYPYVIKLDNRGNDKI